MNVRLGNRARHKFGRVAVPSGGMRMPVSSALRTIEKGYVEDYLSDLELLAVARDEIIRSLNKRTSEFHHISNKLLRRTLEADPRHIRLPELRQATAWTVEALGYDLIDESVSAVALAGRTQAAREALGFLNGRQMTRCHASLRRFWLDA
jgi:hypothetical protein